MEIICSIFIVFALLFSSCNNENIIPNSSHNLTQANILGIYKITSILYKSNPQTPEIDYFMYYDECEKDNLLIFNSNNTHIISEGATAFSPTTSETGN
jgi:hypothetical protein